VQRDWDVAAHRTRLANASWLLKDLPVEVPERDDFASKGLFVTCAVALRLEVLPADRWTCSVARSRIHPNWADGRNVWYLTKDNRLAQCHPLAVDDVRRNGGVLYFPEALSTSLILNVRTDIATAKKVTRETHSYSIDLVVDRLRYGQASRRADLIEHLDNARHSAFRCFVSDGMKADTAASAAAWSYRPTWL
jgi:hypothetical protein